MMGETIAAAGALAACTWAGAEALIPWLRRRPPPQPHPIPRLLASVIGLWSLGYLLSGDTLPAWVVMPTLVIALASERATRIAAARQHTATMITLRGLIEGVGPTPPQADPGSKINVN